MIYSRWRPDRGGYDYFESSEQLALGDDLPVPDLPAGTAIGVGSTEIGRSAPGRLRPLGSGPMARGSILPPVRSAVAGADVTVSVPWLLIALTAGATGYFIGRR